MKLQKTFYGKRSGELATEWLKNHLKYCFEITNLRLIQYKVKGCDWNKQNQRTQIKVSFK